MKGGNISILVAGLLAVVLTIVFILYAPKCIGSCLPKTEGFTAPSSQCKISPVFSKCPFGTNSYIDSLGNMNCCKGEVMGNKCEKPLCSFNKNSLGLPDCKEKVEQVYKQYAKEVCPKKMPNLYYSYDTYSGGCTKGPLNANMEAPLNSSDAFCKLEDYSDKGCAAVKKKELKKECDFAAFTFEDENGNTSCCSVPVDGNTCPKDDFFCTFDDTATGFRRCDQITGLILATGASSCPKSMPNYFYNIRQKYIGCTKSKVVDQYYSPTDVKAPSCVFTNDDKSSNDCRYIKNNEK